MRITADFHIHSRFSRATSKYITIENLEKWARIKGLDVLGTGDFTHPGWFKELKENFINTTIETSGFGRWEDLKNLMEYTDIILYDIKHVNPKKHKELTGVDNKLILENLKKAVESGISKIILRVPLIPGFNDDEENIGSFIGQSCSRNGPNKSWPNGY